MNEVIWKFKIGLGNLVYVRMPIGAKVLSVGMQNTDITVWAEVTPYADLEERMFYVVSTGDRVPDKNKVQFIGTVSEGAFVWHIYVQRVKNSNVELRLLGTP